MALIIREATPADIPALADLHVRTWNATYPNEPKKPTYAIRERQWRQAFEVRDASVFTFVVENESGELVGFARGRPAKHPEFSGELNKLYLLAEYQGMGLGRRLVGHVVQRFLIQGVDTMVLFADPTNPSCGFYEALGADRLLSEKGEFHGGYGWRDLRSLASACPLE